jgi:tRNA (guanine37-N1)-methyltransferase
MRFDVITLFPELFEPFMRCGVIRRAFDSGQMPLKCWNPRDFAAGTYKRVDDRPFGGGPGMVMLAQPLADCLAAVRNERGQDRQQAPLILFSPIGERMGHSVISRWSEGAGAVLLCGRYEGIDQRFIDAEVDAQISLGDFVISGGEIAAMALLDAIARLQPGVLSDGLSAQEDSFHPYLKGLLDCPHYTRPEVWRDHAVPAVLMSGHHSEIDKWRHQQRLQVTAQFRPDLLSLTDQPIPSRRSEKA